ncbi:MAG: hypothetical protein D6805_03845 [Planctomycetota bacterium]|nr:MAG: hypothetical protein D6805_03845 [Planctomycetota bacterium]
MARKVTRKFLVKESTTKEITTQVKNDLLESVDRLTPWFFRTLPLFYYQMTSKEEQINHLHTIISLKQTNAPSATLRSADGKKITFISVSGRTGELLEFLEDLKNVNIRNAAVHSALEGDLLVCHFYTEGFPLDLEDKEVQRRLREIRRRLGKLSSEQARKVENYLQGMDMQYFSRYDAERIHWHIQFYLKIRDYETVFSLDNERDKNFSRISMCTLNPPKTGYLLRVTRILSRYGMKINRLYLNSIQWSLDEDEVVFITLYGVDEQGRKLEPGSKVWSEIQSAIKTVKWVEEDELTTLIGRKDYRFSVQSVNFLRACASFVHQFLSKKQPERYTSEVVKKAFIRRPYLSHLLYKFFEARFDPNIEDICSHCGTDLETRQRRQEEFRGEIEREIHKIHKFVEKSIFLEAFRFIRYILKTNYFLEDNIGLAFRMDPEILDKEHYSPLPFGFFFFYGRGYKGFHVRFEDMSRGGFRLVKTRDKEHYDFESARVFDEVYQLSWAQQLKNKDIPEGGSKAIALLKPGAVLRECVECAIDSLLDILVTYEDGKVHPNIVDYYGKEEIIYLGPDENVSDDMIEWIVERAKKKRYKYPNAFMSSKPGLGINHKKYGVTSHGVNVYVEACLKYLKINPHKDSFTVRMVGGPDGDVAGNELKILIQNYPKVKILAISDGGGAAYDEHGLDHGEIMRLIREGKSIGYFDPRLLHTGERNFVVQADNTEGRRIRDEIQVGNTIITDLFIPAGGRPNTINIDNWEKSLDESGIPVFKAVVEGANLFFSEEARLRLEEKGVIIIKDSSANKGGVICSSYEIIASLLLSEEEFLEIKEQYAYEVIEILKKKARQEAELLFKEHSLRGGILPLTHLSSRISEEINDLTNTIRSMIREALQSKKRPPERYLHMLKVHCPKILVEKYEDRIIHNIPEEHRISIIANQIASYIVYREGLGWIKSLHYDDVLNLVEVYLATDKLVEDYIRTILSSDLEGKEIIAQILEHNARKELTREKIQALKEAGYNGNRFPRAIDEL